MKQMTYTRLLLVLGCAASISAVAIAQNGWATYGNDPGHTRFSTLKQITPENVSQLAKAWEFDTKTPGRKWQNTPVVIGSTMYITLQNGGVVALEPETGKELWRFETPVRGRSVRAVSYLPGDSEASERLLYGAGDKLWALDPKTGKPIDSFGNKGVADVHPGQPASAPTGGSGASDADERPRPGGGGPPGGATGGQGGRGGPGGGRGGGGGFGGGGFSISSPPA